MMENYLTYPVGALLQDGLCRKYFANVSRNYLVSLTQIILITMTVEHLCGAQQMR